MVRSKLSLCLLSLGLNCGWTWSNLLLWCGPFSLKWLPPPTLVIKRLWEAGGTTSYSRQDSTWPGVTAVFTHPHTYRTGRVQSRCGKGWLNLDGTLYMSVAGDLEDWVKVIPANMFLCVSDSYESSALFFDRKMLTFLITWSHVLVLSMPVSVGARTLLCLVKRP